MLRNDYRNRSEEGEDGVRWTFHSISFVLVLSTCNHKLWIIRAVMIWRYDLLLFAAMMPEPGVAKMKGGNGLPGLRLRNEYDDGH